MKVGESSPAPKLVSEVNMVDARSSKPGRTRKPRKSDERRRRKINERLGKQHRMEA